MPLRPQASMPTGGTLRKVPYGRYLTESPASPAISTAIGRVLPLCPSICPSAPLPLYPSTPLPLCPPTPPRLYLSTPPSVHPPRSGDVRLHANPPISSIRPHRPIPTTCHGVMAPVIKEKPIPLHYPPLSTSPFPLSSTPSFLLLALYLEFTSLEKREKRSID